MKNAYITGATGAVGMALVQNLLQHEYHVTVYIRADSPRKQQIVGVFGDNPNFHWLDCGLTELREQAAGEEERTEAVLASTDVTAVTAAESSFQNTEKHRVFFHLGWGGTFGAGRDDADLQNQNVVYTLDAVRLAKRLGCDTFVGAGSQAEYGPKDCALTPDLETKPVMEYGRAKLRAGVESRKLCMELGIRHCWGRILSVYGPYDGVNTMVMGSIRKLLAGEKPSYTKGEQIWDYLYSEDAAEALRRIGEAGRNGAVYCIGSGEKVPLREYIFKIRDCINPDLVVGIGEVDYPKDRSKAVMHLTADISSLTADTGFWPKVSFDEGIGRTVQWYRERCCD